MDFQVCINNAGYKPLHALLEVSSMCLLSRQNILLHTQHILCPSPQWGRRKSSQHFICCAKHISLWDGHVSFILGAFWELLPHTGTMQCHTL